MEVNGTDLDRLKKKNSFSSTLNRARFTPASDQRCDKEIGRRLISTFRSVWRVQVIAVSAFVKNSRRTYVLKLSGSVDQRTFSSIRFALRGNVLDLAIGIIIGTAFTNVVQSLVDDILTPPFGLVLGGVDFVNLTVKMRNFVHQNQPPVVIRYGKFLQALISLLIIALALFFIIKAINRLQKITTKNKDKNKINAQTLASEEVQILREIRDLLARQSPMESTPLCS